VNCSQGPSLLFPRWLKFSEVEHVTNSAQLLKPAHEVVVVEVEVTLVEVVVVVEEEKPAGARRYADHSNSCKMLFEFSVSLMTSPGSTQSCVVVISLGPTE
jgi:hypothetical protein